MLNESSIHAPVQPLTRPIFRVLARLGLVLAVAITFWPALSNGFVWDDLGNFVENNEYRGLGIEQVRWAFTTFLQGPYQPLSWLTLSLDYAMWGMNPQGYHLTNIVLHAANTLLFLGIAQTLISLGWRKKSADHAPPVFLAAVVAAAFFALHPMRVESVAWVTERRDVLSGLFFLLAISFYLRAARSGVRGRLHWGWYSASLMAFVASLLSKAMGMGLPVVLLLLDAYPLGRIDRGAWRRILLEKLPFLACSAAAGVLALIGQAHVGALLPVEEYSLAQRAAHAAYGSVFYLHSMLASLQWSPLYERPVPLDPWQMRYALAGIVALALTIGLVAWRHRFPGILVAWLSYLALAAPVLGVVQAGVQLAADRYSYQATMGLAIVVAAALVAGWRRTCLPTNLRTICAALAIGAPMLWAWLSWNYCRVWENDERLFGYVLKLGPSALAHNNLASIAMEREDRVAAVDHLARALLLVPSFPLARENLIPLLRDQVGALEMESLSRAESALRLAVRTSPDDSQAWVALGLASLRLQNLPQAKTDFDAAVRLNPTDSTAWARLGVVRQMMQDSNGAIEACRRAVALDPQLGDSWLVLGVLLIESGQYAEALPAFRSAATLLPNNTLAWTGLGACLLQLGDPLEAVTALERALLIDPNNSRAASLLQAAKSAAARSTNPTP